MSTTLDPVLESIDTNLDNSVQRLCDLLRIKSISTDSAYNDEIQQAANWLARELTDIGFAASVRETTGHPMVIAHSENKTGPTVLYYGHYDVQPPDPLDLWESDPFEPAIVPSNHGQKIVARGAVDDKGQLMTFVEAFRAWKQVHGEFPYQIKILLEGEEESGSPSLDPFLEANREELAADVCIVCDTGMWDIDSPAITYQLRGMVYVEITLHGPSRDLHSGMYGGSLVNPLNALCSVLGELIDENGIIQIPGFYDDIIPPGKDELASWRALGFDEKVFLDEAGMKTPFGEKGYSTLERIWARPTCDINGIYGGYTGEGAKTVIGSHATAKVSFRMVPGQDPQKVFAGIEQFLNERTPPDCRWEIKSHGLNPAIRVPTESPFLTGACQGLERIYGKSPALIGTGGSIPVVGSFQEILGFDSILIGFGLDDDCVHSPNEKFEMRCFHQGIRSHAAIMDALSGIKP